MDDNSTGPLKSVSMDEAWWIALTKMHIVASLDAMISLLRFIRHVTVRGVGLDIIVGVAH